MISFSKKIFIPILLLPVPILLLLAGASGYAAESQEGIYLKPEYQKAFETSYDQAVNGKYDQAIDPLIKLLPQNPSDYVLHLRLGYLYYLKGDFSLSRDYYEKAVKLRSKAVEPYLGLLLPLMGQKDYKAAVKWGQGALKLDPLNYTLLSTLAYAHYLSGQYSAAIPYYQRLTDLYPSDITMRSGLGWSYLKAGDRIKARREFVEILSLSPTHKMAVLGYQQSK